MTQNPDDFPVHVTVPVQWGDQDALGHVNGARYLTWFESGRVALLHALGWKRVAALGVGPILASITCNYRRPVHYPDTVTIGTRVTEVGNTSLSVEHAIWSERQSAMVADGTSIVVMYDYDQGKSVPVPDELKAAIEALRKKRKE